MHCVMEFFFSCDGFLYVYVQDVVTNVYGMQDLEVEKMDVDFVYSFFLRMNDFPMVAVVVNPQESRRPFMIGASDFCKSMDKTVCDGSDY
jgi:hypothetical protein